MRRRAFKAALIPIRQGVPGFDRTGGQNVLVQYRDAGFRAVQVRNKGRLDTGVFRRAHTG